MREKVRAFMEQYHMVTAGERVLLGLSGGADSVCLFHLLRELQEPLGFSLLAVHVNQTCAARKPGGMRHLQKICAGNMMFRSISIPVPWRRSQKKSISRRRRRDARRGRKFLQRAQRSRGQ